MDSIISSALEEICSQGQSGLPLSALWLKLHSSPALSPAFKSSLWSNLIKIPTLQFKVNQTTYAPTDPAIQSLEDAEKLSLKVVANQNLRDNFVGLYDVQSANAGVSAPQRRALERLAIARKNGITQRQLGKEFGVEGNNLFYIVRNLECRGLIVRQTAVERTKGTCNEGEVKNSSIVTTNLLFLHRYAKHLGSQQRFEITNENGTNGDGLAAECGKEDVLVKDYLPGMKAICDKLEEAADKVLVVSDIKQDLGYCGSTSRHRAWRDICRRLKNAHIVEKFDAKVNGKVEHCLRLLKKFSPKNFGPKGIGYSDDDFNKEQRVKFGSGSQITDQLMELPIEQQIYDMIDAEGSKGLNFLEVCKRLGIDNKRNYFRLRNLCNRFGVHMQAENHNKTVAYRVWTNGNFNLESCKALLSKSMDFPGENKISSLADTKLDVPDRSVQNLECDPSASKDDFATPGKVSWRNIDTELSHGSPGDGKANGDVQELLHDSSERVPDADLNLVCTAMEIDVATLETATPALSKPSKSYQRYPRLTLTAAAAKREDRILERLQDEKFILRGELHRWLVSIEKDKCTATDRKTIDRILNKLQQQGLCKCVPISFPAVTNCGVTRPNTVVLHPSIGSLHPELVSKIHDKLRAFEMQTRSQSSLKWKNNESVPVLNSVQRIQTRANSDVQVVKSEAMRTNGFVLAKMVRAKLLHRYLWDYLSRSCDSDVTLSSWKHVQDFKNPLRSFSLFSLEAAIRAIPLELFLQVAGSTQKFDDMIDKCKRGLCLSDLPVLEYKCLMDTQATGRISVIVEILRRLKLIRLASTGHSEDGVKVSHSDFTHELELKPYIEEPSSIVGTFPNFRSLDRRPRIRHDFILLNREAIDKYWQTLEYCYSAANREAALHAFPGSAVNEVFLHRSWTSVRVMTADQRADLLNRIMKDYPYTKLPYKECEKIAKDLNLTFEQVLRVHYDKRQHRLSRFQGTGEEFQPPKSKQISSSRKRKRSREAGLGKGTRFDAVTAQLSKQRLARLPDTADQFMKEEIPPEASSPELDIELQVHQDDDHPQNEEAEPYEGDWGCHSLISECALSKTKPARQRRFLWTDEADRQLVIQYVRHRATLGAKFHRVDWASLSDLPAHPRSCGKRMASLRRKENFRKAVMRLCNMLSQRYAKHLKESQNWSLNNDDFRLSRGSQGTSFEAERWDDFDDKNIKIALKEVLRQKNMPKLEVSKEVGSVSEEWEDLNTKGYDPQESELMSSANPIEDIQNLGVGKRRDFAQRSSHGLHKKFIKLLNDGINVSGQIYESLAVSNAVELFKLVFLSTSTGAEAPNLLAETLRRYSEHDLFAAFSYLREKKIMIGGTGGQPFSLSQQFLQNCSKSPFPGCSGKRAAKFSSWLHEREKDMMEGGFNLPSDLQCGDIFHLFALIYSGEMSIFPSLPDEGVGEPEDFRSLKRKADDDEAWDGDRAKKLKSSTESELASRREKGFPGIMVSVHRATILRANAVELFKNGETSSGELLVDWNDEFNTALDQKVSSSSSNCDHFKEINNFGSFASITGNSRVSPWEAMAHYAGLLMSKPSDQEQATPFYPEVFRAVYTAIQKAGDQGLSIGEVSQVVNSTGEELIELIIDVLQVFGRALKANAFDSLRVVDALYRSKYFLTSTVGFCQDPKLPSLAKSPGRIDHDLQPENHDISNTDSQRETGNVHRVTILNLPEEVAAPVNEIGPGNVQEDCVNSKVVSPEGDNESETCKLFSGELCLPILPWINGDGTVNTNVYKGLVRSVLGTVMQNPGILENDIIRLLDVLNPQSCRRLLELMILDKHLIVRKMNETKCNGPPVILGSLLGSKFRKPKLICRKHFFANPMSSSFL